MEIWTASRCVLWGCFHFLHPHCGMEKWELSHNLNVMQAARYCLFYLRRCFTLLVCSRGRTWPHLSAEQSYEWTVQVSAVECENNRQPLRFFSYYTSCGTFHHERQPTKRATCNSLQRKWRLVMIIHVLYFIVRCDIMGGQIIFIVRSGGSCSPCPPLGFTPVSISMHRS